jgi:hypothetical protein
MKYLLNHFYLILFMLAFVACQSNEDNNEALEYEKLGVNFSIKTTGFDMPENTTYGIAAYCARNNQDGVQMNEVKKISVYYSINSGSFSNLVKASDSDLIEASASDHNFNFCAVYPYDTDVDFKAVEAVVPAIQNYEDGVGSYLTFTAHTRVTSIVPTTAFEMTTPFAVLNLSVPLDIIEEGVSSTLKSITITPSKADNFSGAIAGGGSIDAETGVFTLSSTNTSTSIRLDFPAEGLALRDARTIIPVAVLPFTVPEGGFDIEFEGTDGSYNSTRFLNQISDAGSTIEAGSITNVTISHSADGVIPVTFPVEFLLGKVDNVPRVTPALQPRWVSEGVWTCQEQPQSYARWYSVSDPGAGTYQFFYEIVNSGDISTPGIKGVWTGDYLEFVIPVKRIPANQRITMQIPFYGRQQPVFWNIKYLDGEEWKIFDLHEETCYDGVTKMNCTFSLGYDVIKICSFTMTLENEVKSGYLKFRLECANGSIQSAISGVYVRSIPFVDGSGKYAAPCYFRTDRGVTVKEISFTLE